MAEDVSNFLTESGVLTWNQAIKNRRYSATLLHRIVEDERLSLALFIYLFFVVAYNYFIHLLCFNHRYRPD